jgi:hypothetical protein
MNMSAEEPPSAVRRIRITGVVKNNGYSGPWTRTESAGRRFVPKHLLVLLTLLTLSALLFAAGWRLTSKEVPRFELVPVKSTYWVQRFENKGCFELWLVREGGRRDKLSTGGTSERSVIRTNDVVLWQESRLARREMFHDEYDNVFLVADSSGRVAEITSWLEARAVESLPGAAGQQVSSYFNVGWPRLDPTKPVSVVLVASKQV